MAKKSRKETLDDKEVQKHLDEIKKDLEELRTKLGMTGRGDFTKLPMEAVKKVSETSSEIIKTASDIVEKAVKVAQFTAMGAMEGAKKALKEEVKKKKS